MIKDKQKYKDKKEFISSKNAASCNDIQKVKNIQPVGRTFLTNDKYLPHDDKNAYKDVDVVNIENNKKGEMIVVRLSKQKTKNTSPLKHHTYKGFKHFVEIEDIDKQPIINGQRFKQNSSYYDLTNKQIDFISDIVYNHLKQSQRNQKNRDKFRNRYHK